MLAWRTLLYSSVRSLMSCLALSVAFFIATMRALCSEALASSTTGRCKMLHVVREQAVEHRARRSARRDIGGRRPRPAPSLPSPGMLQRCFEARRSAGTRSIVGSCVSVLMKCVTRTISPCPPRPRGTFPCELRDRLRLRETSGVSLQSNSATSCALRRARGTARPCGRRRRRSSSPGRTWRRHAEQVRVQRAAQALVRADHDHGAPFRLRASSSSGCAISRAASTALRRMR